MKTKTLEQERTEWDKFNLQTLCVFFFNVNEYTLWQSKHMYDSTTTNSIANNVYYFKSVCIIFHCALLYRFPLILGKFWDGIKLKKETEKAKHQQFSFSHIAFHSLPTFDTLSTFFFLSFFVVVVVAYFLFNIIFRVTSVCLFFSNFIRA